jgi:hypothetical protein
MQRGETRRWAAPGGRATTLVVVAAMSFITASCSDDDGADAADDAAIYTAVIREVAPGTSPTMPKVVFVELEGGAELSLEDQAAVVNAFPAPVTVRFIDDRDEAIDDKLPQSHVRREGVLVRLRPTESTDAGVSVQVTRYVARDDEQRLCLELTEAKETWTVASAASC